jgi:hypothetical protein
MGLDITRAIWIIWGAVLLSGVSTLGYREYLGSDAHWITNILCEDMPVISGKYRQCLEHYAPAAAGSTSVELR